MSTVEISNTWGELNAIEQLGRHRLNNRAHSRAYMPSIPPSWAQSRTHVRSIAHPSSTSTSRSRAISKLTGGLKLTVSWKRKISNTWGELVAIDQFGPSRLTNRAHSRAYMPSVPSFLARSRTHVHSLAYQSASSTSKPRSISKLTDTSDVTVKISEGAVLG